MKTESVLRKKRSAFTLVEMLVVIAILGTLMSLLLPAVSRIQETGRVTSCQNNLSQMAKGAAAHQAKYGFYPSSGWGYMWTGDPDMGASHKQPGGYVFNLLPYIGEQGIHDIGKGLTGNAKKAELKKGMEKVVPLLMCPSRRKVTTYPDVHQCYNADTPDYSSKTDYAINGGTRCLLGFSPSGCAGSYPKCKWLDSVSPEFNSGLSPDDSALSSQFNSIKSKTNPDITEAQNWTFKHCTGVSTMFSEIRMADITDGPDRTIMFGEKNIEPRWYYDTTNGPADNTCMLQGNDWDVNRWAERVPPNEPLQSPDAYKKRRAIYRDSPGTEQPRRFGSAHAVGANFAFCGGAVRTLPYTIDPLVFEHLCSRNDGACDPDPW